MARRTLSFPQVFWRADGDYEFSYVIPLDRPFVLRGGSYSLFELRLVNSTLCWNQLPHELGNLDWVEPYAPPGGWVTPAVVGTGCGRSGYPAPGVRLYGLAPAAGNHEQEISWVLQFGGFTGASQTLFFAGTNAQTWNGLPLPYALDALGAPGCAIYASLDWLLPRRSEVPYTATAWVGVPNNGALVGASFLVQGVRIDPLFNPLGVITTNALRMTVHPHVHALASNCFWNTQSSTAVGNAKGVAFGGPVMMIIGG